MIVAPIVSAIILGFLPYLLKYLSTGVFDVTDINNTYLAVISGLAGLISTPVAELIKKDVAADS
jgi:hypothetical protein